ncbi:NADH-ubiquinone/plastoquinone oxidoreductase chain 3 [mine drainage metagenome]|uniref:NADH-ubiquinone/plastoquinone oxidoreductase chain 3 n=1 Tax=mine drainage metagenome TaxID=410659 RepID=T1B6L0_9ZZZZ
MFYTYIALIFFIAFALFIPAAFLLTAKLLGHREPGNKAKNAPYESGELPIGSSRDIDNEYLPYFTAFLPFEIVAVVLLVWSVASPSLGYTTNLLYIMLPIFSLIFVFISYKLIRGRNA